MQLNNLPKDPAMLLSYINTELRDSYSDLTEFCAANNADINDITGRLRTINYSYNEHLNQFV
jgi:hypothetical protein